MNIDLLELFFSKRTNFILRKVNGNDAKRKEDKVVFSTKKNESHTRIHEKHARVMRMTMTRNIRKARIAQRM